MLRHSVYTIKEAAQRTGVSVALLRAWERRYGIVAPLRTEAGYRIYDDAAVARIRAMRTLVADGWSPRQAAANINSTHACGCTTHRPATADRAIQAAGRGRRPDRRAGPRTRAGRHLRDGKLQRMVDDHLYRALGALGDAWARGEVDVAGEHAASAADGCDDSGWPLTLLQKAQEPAMRRCWWASSRLPP